MHDTIIDTATQDVEISGMIKFELLSVQDMGKKSEMQNLKELGF